MLFHGDVKTVKSNWAPKGLLITTHEMVEKELSFLTDKKAWHVVVVDEAHSLKNMHSVRYSNMRAIHGAFRLLLNVRNPYLFTSFLNTNDHSVFVTRQAQCNNQAPLHGRL